MKTCAYHQPHSQSSHIKCFFKCMEKVILRFQKQQKMSIGQFGQNSASALHKKKKCGLKSTICESYFTLVLQWSGP